MARVTVPSPVPFLHVQINLSLTNDPQRSWGVPNAESNISFVVLGTSIDGKTLTDLINAQVKALPSMLEAETLKAKLEAETKAQMEADAN